MSIKSCLASAALVLTAVTARWLLSLNQGGLHEKASDLGSPDRIGGLGIGARCHGGDPRQAPAAQAILVRAHGDRRRVTPCRNGWSDSCSHRRKRSGRGGANMTGPSP